VGSHLFSSLLNRERKQAVVSASVPLQPRSQPKQYHSYNLSCLFGGGFFCHIDPTYVHERQSLPS
jgi:hypothetical protein